MFHPPTFIKKPAIKQEDDGNRLLLECRIQSDPEPTITWTHNGKPVVAKGRFKTVQKKEGNFYNVALIIDDVQNEDGGKYQPAFIGKPLIKPSPDFTKVTFECKLEADPKPTIQWFHNGKPVKDSARQKYGLAVQKDKSYLVTLDIQNLSSEDGGTYKALAKNSAGESTATINLNLEGEIWVRLFCLSLNNEHSQIPGGKEPKFLKKPTIRQENENLLIEVNIEANPKPKISWFLGS
ncbi:unc-22 [Cordylochernes scorpioides]|uniref:Unc-22 n=1 Tax=Cordylochernes scorpioides TaxID=51811 RepID=A0ABY6LE37_9ARAC|nr:unc-22 [Cordylochernes scorpioides]